MQLQGPNLLYSCGGPVRHNGADELGAARGSGICVHHAVISCIGTNGGVPTDESVAQVCGSCVTKTCGLRGG